MATVSDFKLIGGHPNVGLFLSVVSCFHVSSVEDTTSKALAINRTFVRLSAVTESCVVAVGIVGRCMLFKYFVIVLLIKACMLLEQL